MNKDIKRRDEIIFGKYEKDKYFGGIRRFECPREVIEQLIKEDFIDLEENQNCSPTVKEFMELTDKESGLGNAEFECYAVSIDRDDYRVTIEGIDLEISDDDMDVFIYAIQNLRSADEFDIVHKSCAFFIHAWWD